MIANSESLGGRLPLVEPADMTDPQRELYDSVLANQQPWAEAEGFLIKTDDGRLIGPFNAFLRNARVAQSFLAFSAAEMADTSLPERVREIVIVVVGAVWNAEYELYAHKKLAANLGLSPAEVGKLSSGAIPESLSEPERIAAQVALQLSTRHRIDDELYRSAAREFSEQAMTSQP